MKLVIGNSESKIEGLTLEQYRKVKKALSYEIDSQAAHFSRSWNKTRSLIDKHGIFPTGLIHYLSPHLTIDNLVIDDTRVYPDSNINFQLNLPYTPYVEQIEAAMAASKHGRGIIVAPTGIGKSAIAALMIKELGVKTLIVVPSLVLKEQTTEFLRSVYTSHTIGAIAARPQIAVENVDSLDPSKVIDYDCVIIDEFHHAGAATYRKLNKKAWKNVYYRFGLTATPFRSKDDEKMLLESILADVIYKIDYRTAVKKGYIVPVEAYYVDIPKTKIKGNPKSWASMYSELVVNNETRNALIQKLLVTFQLSRTPVLCLVKEIKHGLLLSEDNYVFAHGDNPDTPHLIGTFNKERFKTLIGTDGVIGEGVDTKPATVVIIAGLGKARGRFMQQVGRAVRVYPGKTSAKIIIFRDPSHPWTLKHFRAQCKTLEDEYGIVAKKLNV